MRAYRELTPEQEEELARQWADKPFCLSRETAAVICRRAAESIAEGFVWPAVYGLLDASAMLRIDHPGWSLSLASEARALEMRSLAIKRVNLEFHARYLRREAELLLNEDKPCRGQHKYRQVGLRGTYDVA